VTSDGEVESLLFTEGVNLITGEPNAGKTTWMKQIDFILGKDASIVDVFPDSQLSYKYVKLLLNCKIADEIYEIYRLPLEPGFASKIFINDNSYSYSEFSSEILQLLQVPFDVKFPKGNPYTTQWVSLSFRSIFRHIYRKEDSWNDIADKQPNNEQYASQFHLLGIADKLFSNELNISISNEKRLLELQSKKAQFEELITRIAKEMTSNESFMYNSINSNVLKAEVQELNDQLKGIENQRGDIIQNRIDNLELANKHAEVNLSAIRADIYKEREEITNNISKFTFKINDFQEIRQSITDELSRLKRAKKSGIISELKITHCPACDQKIDDTETDDSRCFLCHKSTLGIETKKSNRIDFEIEQLENEQNELGTILHDHNNQLSKFQDLEKRLSERIFSIDKELETIKKPLHALNDNEISTLDVQKGRIIEQILNYNRLIENYNYKGELEDKIRKLEIEINREKAFVELETSEVNFESIANDLASGMQEYVDNISKTNPKVWTQKGRIEISLSETKISFYVNNKSWMSLGGLDRQLFLLSYHYGLLKLSYKKKYNYPGIAFIDLPPELGKVKDTSYNYLLSPFVFLMNSFKDKNEDAQVIILGRAFTGIRDVNNIRLITVWN